MVIKNYEITEWPALKWVLDCWKFYGDTVRLLIVFYILSFIYASRAFSRSLHFGPPNDLRLGSQTSDLALFLGIPLQHTSTTSVHHRIPLAHQASIVTLSIRPFRPTLWH